MEPGICVGSAVVLTLFNSTKQIIVFHPEIGFHFYADDTQLYVHLSRKNAFTALTKLNACLRDVQRWMAFSKLYVDISFSKHVCKTCKACFLQMCNLR